ncbi:MAG TPA: glycosyltransferase family 87 protein [Solirubrobacterales bacterium]|nr:glycosyltransferase family 87 protein [Solirubrobacterales bacterium]
MIRVGFWDHVHALDLQDVIHYDSWSHLIVSAGSLPAGPAWQYPPGAALVMVVPRLALWFSSYGQAFVALMLLVDLAGLALLIRFGRRTGNYTGVWVWLLALPLLGSLPVLRFDLVPAVLTIAALVAIHRRPDWFGALVGLGAAIKVWPVVLLFGEWDRGRLARAIAAAASVLAVVFVATWIGLGNPLGFLSAQGGRGLQEEAVATLPWDAWEVTSGEPTPRHVEYGSIQIDSGAARAASTALELLSLAALIAAAAWWLARTRAIAAGRQELASEDVSRDFLFALVLLLVITSRVLSPQYMIWLLALAALVLSAERTRLARPAWVVIGATVLTTSVFGSAENGLIRNLALLVATVDASVAMVLLVRPRTSRSQPVSHRPSTTP